MAPRCVMATTRWRQRVGGNKTEIWFELRLQKLRTLPQQTQTKKSNKRLQTIARTCFVWCVYVLLVVDPLVRWTKFSLVFTVFWVIEDFWVFGDFWVLPWGVLGLLRPRELLGPQEPFWTFGSLGLLGPWGICGTFVSLGTFGSSGTFLDF